MWWWRRSEKLGETIGDVFLEKLEIFLLLFGVDVGELVATNTNPAEEGSLIVLRRSHDYIESIRRLGRF